jgi:CHAD domain-containing protein
MNKDKIKEVIVEKTEEITVLCEKINNGFDMQDIHDFRVAFKYLRSFLRLIRMHNDNKGLKAPDKLKDLYYIAGYIRDAQIELLNITEEQLGLPDYNNELEKRISALKKDWTKSYTNKILLQFVKRLKNYEFEALPAGVLANFLNSRMASIDDNMRMRTPTDVQMHNVRKHAKDIINTTHAVKKKHWTAAEVEIKSMPLKELTHVADEIGNYNDERFHLVTMKQYSEQIVEAADKAKIKQISKEQQPKVAKHKKNIIKLVKELLVRNNN